MVVFPNLYYKRTAATAKACYVCYKPTVTVLATIDTADFFYTCPIHLTDRGFATRAPDPEPEVKKASVSPEEIAKVKQGWEEKQRQKKEKEKREEVQVDGEGKKDTQGAGGKGADAGTNADSDSKRENNLATVAPSPSAEATPSKPTHERYTLHRDIFSLRTADHRRRRQAAQTKDLAPRLPGAPKGSLPP